MKSPASAGAVLPPPPTPRWELPEPPDPTAVRSLADELTLPPALCAVLAVRGITHPDEARAFLRPRLEALHNPAKLTDAARAADRIEAAIRRDERIFVHGDYDVDGICSTALLTLGLRSLGARVEPFVPHRIEDGYDLSRRGVDRARAAGAKLIVTCDSGIVAHDPIEYARELGIDVIITDHHAPGDRLPRALAIVNPARSDCTYPEKGLCGAAVAFKVLELMWTRRGRDRSELLAHLDLVALATVADLVPLTGENRILARFGLRHLARTTRPGLRALISTCGLDGPEHAERLEAGQVGFQLAPRINAVGRLGAARDGLELLLTGDPVRARELAHHLDRLNEQRRDEDRRTLDEAIEALARSFDPVRDFGVVVAGEGWHPGVIGIVASRVVERVHRPAILIAIDGERGRGSARSIPEIHLHEALTDCREHLTRFGGHRQAAGMELESASVDAFRKAFNRAVKERLNGRAPEPRLRADLELPLDRATDELHHWLQYLGPFGIGNPRPVFVARGAAIRGAAREVGRGHLKLRVGQDGGTLDAIGFGLAERLPPASLGPSVDVVFQLRQNRWRGRTSLQARLLDLRSGD